CHDSPKLVVLKRLANGPGVTIAPVRALGDQCATVRVTHVTIGRSSPIRHAHLARSELDLPASLPIQDVVHQRGCRAGHADTRAGARLLREPRPLYPAQWR